MPEEGQGSNLHRFLRSLLRYNENDLDDLLDTAEEDMEDLLDYSDARSIFG